MSSHKQIERKRPIIFESNILPDEIRGIEANKNKRNFGFINIDN
jgi:hypothetical protein